MNTSSSSKNSNLGGLLVLIFGALLCYHSCTDAGIQPIITDTITYYDNKYAVDGRYCTQPADDVAFPVKILLMMDQSASLQVTDPQDNRLDALDLMAADLDPLPHVEFGVIGFASWSRITDFTPNWADVSPVLAPQAGQGGPATDYQGSLSTALRILEQDMLEAGPAIRARTKYVVLFFSDGSPMPQCTAGCDDDNIPPDMLYDVCNTTQDISDDVYVDMHSLCPDYNQPMQIAQKIQDIMSLSDFYGVGDLSVSSIFLFAGDLPEFGVERAKAEPMMRMIAEEGNGTFRDVNISTELDFLKFNYESLKAPYRLSEFFAINMNSLPSNMGPAEDSDGDGVSDDIEFQNQMNRKLGDSDGDMFGDLFELTYASRGFDPTDALVPAMGCIDAFDRDGDGLLDCEEQFLGLDPLIADSDGDRIPDGLELRLGLDPMLHDSGEDYDFDGVFSGVEVRAGTSPVLADADQSVAENVLYRVEQVTEESDEIQCYDFTVQQVSLVITMPTATTQTGENRILIFALEEPANMAGTRGAYKVACLEATYLGETFKEPPDGEVSNLSADRFIDLALFDPELHCFASGTSAFDTDSN